MSKSRKVSGPAPSGDVVPNEPKSLSELTPLHKLGVSDAGTAAHQALLFKPVTVSISDAVSKALAAPIFPSSLASAVDSQLLQPTVLESITKALKPPVSVAASGIGREVAGQAAKATDLVKKSMATPVMMPTIGQQYAASNLASDLPSAVASSIGEQIASASRAHLYTSPVQDALTALGAGPLKELRRATEQHEAAQYYGSEPAQLAYLQPSVPKPSHLLIEAPRRREHTSHADRVASRLPGKSDVVESADNRPAGAPAVRLQEQAPILSVADVGQRIREARRAMGMTQQSFADLAGVGRRFLSELEHGKASLEMGRVLAVCQAAGIKLGFLG
ncbi:helix-turn-helix transcriptional regulator [Novosphingobium terrae]|uniref:helix-turn-helix transcriptional regulator n=1 Tax=Novosphingobium terrae TaxID=2726189 RepID=UPI001F1369F0|nr:helix-turn-helix transcriptional regulator [Novosphingobium terrae]